MNNQQGQPRPLSVAYFGSPEYSAKVLAELIQSSRELNIAVQLVCTQPDRPAGRKLLFQETAVKKRAKTSGIHVCDAVLTQRSDEVLTLFHTYSIDLAIVFAFNEIISPSLLAYPRYGFWNIHPSLLPRYRGASPITLPLALGDTHTGVSLIKMDAGLDSGPLIDQVSFDIHEHDTHQDILDSSVVVAIQLLKKAIPQAASLTAHPQDAVSATYTRKLTRQDGFVPYSDLMKIIHGESTPYRPLLIDDYYRKNPNVSFQDVASYLTLFRLYKALYPWPGVWTLIPTSLGEKRLKINRISMGENRLDITHVQMEGRREVTFGEFRREHTHLFTHLP